LEFPKREKAGMKKYARGALVAASTDIRGSKDSSPVGTTSHEKEAMSLLGITELDIDPLSLHHFMKHTTTLDEASLLYRKHSQRRAQLRDQLAQKREELARAPESATSSRRSQF
jgi:hypothetical protein